MASSLYLPAVWSFHPLSIGPPNGLQKKLGVNTFSDKRLVTDGFFLQSSAIWPTDLRKRLLISLHGFIFQGTMTYWSFFCKWATKKVRSECIQWQTVSYWHFFLQSSTIRPTNLRKRLLISLCGFIFQGAMTYRSFFLQSSAIRPTDLRKRLLISLRGFIFQGTMTYQSFFLQSSAIWPTDLQKRLLISPRGFIFQGAITYWSFFLNQAWFGQPICRAA
jgi:hypothetical protein